MKVSFMLWALVAFILGVALVYTPVGFLGLLLVGLSFFSLVAGFILPAE